MKKINILHTEWSTGWDGQELRILSESLALRDTYGGAASYKRWRSFRPKG